MSENSELASRDRVKTVASDNGGIGGGGRKSHVQKPEGLLSERLGLLYGDGYGTHSVADYLDGAREMVRPDGGPPRWFSPVDCGSPIEGSPVLLFLPGNCYGLWFMSCDSVSCDQMTRCWIYRNVQLHLHSMLQFGFLITASL